MGILAYTLCSVASLLCAVLLWRGYRRTGTRLLLWSAICFACLTLNNLLVLLDLVIFPEIDLFLPRTLAAFVGIGALLFGLIWEDRK
ncbi:MAG TPA: DUF5985 family protein [Gemmatimonadales bacterium]|jgi:hypothetical protein